MQAGLRVASPSSSSTLFGRYWSSLISGSYLGLFPVYSTAWWPWLWNGSPCSFGLLVLLPLPLPLGLVGVQVGAGAMLGGLLLSLVSSTGCYSSLSLLSTRWKSCEVAAQPLPLPNHTWQLDSPADDCASTGWGLADPIRR